MRLTERKRERDREYEISIKSIAFQGWKSGDLIPSSVKDERASSLKSYMYCESDEILPNARVKFIPR